MTKIARVRDCDIENALRIATAHGLPVAELRIEPNCARLIFGVATKPKTPEGEKPKQWPTA